MKTMILESIAGVMSTNKTAQIANALISLEVGSGQLALKQQLVQQLNATQDRLVMDIVMISITTWTATMTVETVEDVMSKYSTAQHANALTPLETCPQ